MGEYKNKAYTLRLNNELMSKVRKLADKEDRPLSRQLEKIVKEYIAEYETEHGPIELKDLDE